VAAAALLLLFLYAGGYLEEAVRFLFPMELVPEEGVSYSFDDNTLQGWTSTTGLITVRDGRVEASAPGDGSRTDVYTYTFDGDLGGWEITGDAGVNRPELEKAEAEWVGELRDNAVYLKAYAYSPYSVSWDCRTWAWAWIRKQFDFTGCESVTVRFISTSENAVIKAYKSVGGREGDLLRSWSIPSHSTWTEVELDLSDVAGQAVWLYFGVECPSTNEPRNCRKTLWIDNLEVKATKPPFTAEGYIEKEFSFTRGFGTGTIRAITIQVDYASEASWNGFWGLKIFEGDVELGSWEFTKGYMAWRTFTVDVKDLVAGKTVKVKIGGVISSASRWFIDNVRISYDVEYPFITVALDSSYPAHQWVNVSVTLGVKQAGLLVVAELGERGFEGVTDENGVATVKILTPEPGTYPVKFAATNPNDGQRYEVEKTLTVLPSIKASISAEATQHYDNPVTFTVTTVDPDRNIPVDADALNVKVVHGGREVAATIQKLGTGEYHVSFTVNAEGTAKVTVTPQKHGYYPVADTAEITVVKPKIVLTVNIPPEVTAGGSAEVYIKTTTPSGEQVDVDSVTVQVTTPSGVDQPASTARITKGMYQATVRFEEEGVYQVKIQVADSTYGSTSATYTVNAAKRELIPGVGDFALPAGIGAAAVAAAIAILKRRGTL